MCTARESNPGRKNGNLAWYHYTSSANELYSCKFLYLSIEYSSPTPKCLWCNTHFLPTCYRYIEQSQKSNFGVIIISLVYTKEALKPGNVIYNNNSPLILSVHPCLEGSLLWLVLYWDTVRYQPPFLPHLSIHIPRPFRETKLLGDKDLERDRIYFIITQFWFFLER